MNKPIDPQKFTHDSIVGGNGERIKEVTLRYWKHMNFYKKINPAVEKAKEIFTIDKSI